MDDSKVEELRRQLKEHGYELYGVTSFKRHDRVIFGNSQVKISLNLRGKLSEIALETLVNACIGKEA